MTRELVQNSHRKSRDNERDMDDHVPHEVRLGHVGVFTKILNTWMDEIATIEDAT